MSDEDFGQKASAQMKEALADIFTGDQRAATKEDVAKIYSLLIDLRDIVTANASIASKDQLDERRLSLLSHYNKALSSMQKGIGEGVLLLAGRSVAPGGDKDDD